MRWTCSIRAIRSADHEDALRVKAMIQEKVAFQDLDEKTKAAVIGNEEWIFPLPLVLEDGRWRFDTATGREELLNRRIGRNELLALASLHAYVDAQREYFTKGRDGKPPAYARRFRSTEGKHDGLYWPVAEGEEESPLGPLYAEAAHEQLRSRMPNRSPSMAITSASSKARARTRPAASAVTWTRRAC